MEEAAALLPDLDLPQPVAHAAAGALRRRARPLPLRPGVEGRLHAVRALRFYGPGDLRLEEVPPPEPGPGDVLVQVEVALTDGTDLKAFRPRPSGAARRAAQPLRARVLRDRRRDRQARRRGELGRDGRARRAARAAERRLRGAPPVPGGDRPGEPPPRPGGPRARGGRDGRAARVLPARRRAGGGRKRRPRRHPRRGPDRPDARRLRRGTAAGRRWSAAKAAHRASCRPSAASPGTARAPTS